MKTSCKLLILFCLSSVAAAADEAALKRCRAISDSAARLACYDALPVGAAAPATPSPAQAAAAASTTPGATAAAAPTLYPKQSPDQFGMERKATDVELKEIHSAIPGRFEGFRPNLRLKLANGQVWQVADDTRRIYDRESPKVTIERGALGVFYLSLDGDNLNVRVKRVE